MKHYKISQETIDIVLNYLANQPYANVFKIFDSIKMMSEIVEPAIEPVIPAEKPAE